MDPNSIVDRIRSEIETATLRPGAILKQEELAARFQVSRQPIRQALDRLLEAGLVHRRPDRSMEVAGLSEEEARELTDIRATLEAMALRSALPNLSATALRRAARIAADIADEDDPAGLEELDVEFHRTLYAPCGNARLLSMIEALRRESRRTYAVQPDRTARRAALAAEHEALLKACRDGDAAAAITYLTAHIRGVRADLTSIEPH